jgi:hypothetical protein
VGKGLIGQWDVNSLGFLGFKMRMAFHTERERERWGQSPIPAYKTSTVSPRSIWCKHPKIELSVLKASSSVLDMGTIRQKLLIN